MKWIEPVTDRTQADYLNEQSKGACNYKDLNRVEGNCAVIADMLDMRLSIKAWSRYDLYHQSQFSRIRANVDTLRLTGYVYRTTPLTPPNPLNTIDRWNDLEQIIKDIHFIVVVTLDAKLYTGEGYAGQEIGVL